MNNINKFSEFRVLSSERIAQPWVRFVALTIYYVAILVGLIAIYGKGDFSTPPFIYQNF